MTIKIFGNNMSYTIIRAVTNNYDTIFECNDAEADKRLLFTDKPANVKKWEQRIISANKEFPFDDIFNIRWKPFEHTNTDYVIWLDGSLKILGSVKPYIEAFEKSGADVALLKHPVRDNIYAEYFEWCRIRNYKKIQAFNWMAHMEENGWNPKNKGLYQVTVCIFKNTTRVKEFGKAVIEELHNFNGEHLERLDQTVVTYLLKTKFKDIKVFELDEKMYKTESRLRLCCSHPNH